MKKGAVPIAGYFLVVILIGVVFLFVYFASPDCYFKDMECFESYATSRTIGVRLMNEYRYPIDIETAEIEIDGKDVVCDFEPISNIDDIQIFDLIFYNCSTNVPLVIGREYKYTVKLGVKRTTEAFPKTNSGYIITTVKPGIGDEKGK
jgi:hypothetical protein